MGIIITQELALKNFYKKHKDTYDYSKVKYIKSSNKVIIICKQHGEFLQTPNSHLSGNGCPKCTPKNIAKKLKKTLEQFIKEATKKHKGKYTYEKVLYINAVKNIIITCDTHGYFSQIPRNHLTGAACPKCSNMSRGILKRYSKEDFIEKVIQVHGDKYDYTKTDYTKSNCEIIITCKIHGDFSQIATQHLSGSGCRKCTSEKRWSTERITTKEFIEKANKVHNNKYTYLNSEYKKSSENIIITCKIHGDFSQNASGHLSGRGCYACVKDTGGFSKKDYINKSKGRETTLYIIECSNEDELFYKIGRTFHSVKKRYAGSAIPYNYKIIYEFKSETGIIYDLENRFKKRFRDFKYQPKIIFAGQTECFTKLLPIDEIKTYTECL